MALAARRMPHHAGPARRHRALAWFRLPRQGHESVGHLVGDEGADVGEMVEADVFGGAFLGGEDFEKLSFPRFDGAVVACLGRGRGEVIWLGLGVPGGIVKEALRNACSAS